MVRRRIIRHGEDRLEPFDALRPVGAAPDLRPERALPPESGGVELVLRPAEQRRYEQACQVEVVERLDGEAGGGEHVLHRERRRQEQPIDAGHRHPLRVEARDQQRGKVAAAADENEDILGPKRSPLPLHSNGLSSQRRICLASLPA
jgi:hypothetical protein